jgi:hypothetical protein
MCILAMVDPHRPGKGAKFKPKRWVKIGRGPAQAKKRLGFVLVAIDADDGAFFAIVIGQQQILRNKFLLLLGQWFCVGPQVPLAVKT